MGRLIPPAAVLALVMSACSPPIGSGPSLAPSPAADMSPLPVGEEAIFLLLQRQPTRQLPVIGATLEDRGSVELLRLSSDARRVTSTTEAGGIGLTAFAGGKIARLVPAQGGGVATELEILDPQTLRTEGRRMVPGSSQVAADPRTGAIALSAPGTLRILSPDLGRTREVDLGAAVGRTDCGDRRPLLFGPEGDLVLAGVCSTSPRGFFVLVARPDGSRRVFATPANEYGSPYALSPQGDRLYVAKPSTSELWALRLSDGALMWHVSYGTASGTDLKWIGAPAALEVSPDGSSLYLISSSRPGAARGVRVFDAATGAARATWLPETPITGMDLADRGRQLLVTTTDEGGGLIAVDTATGHAEVRLRQLAVDGGAYGRRNVVGIAVLGLP